MTDTSATRNKLAKRPEGNGAPSQAAVVRQAIERQSDAFRQVLPAGVDAARFSRLVLSAIKSTPDLMRCFGTAQGEMSVLLAAMQAAAIGLEPNTPTNECWILPRQNKGTWEAQLSIGYRGELKLVRRAGNVKTVYAEVVRERDVFHWSRGLEADELTHTPAEGDRGELRFAYAVARFKDGGYSFEVLDRHQVEKRRAMSDSWRNEKARPYSPWTKWPEAMWRKSAIRALIPYLDLSSATSHAIATDDTVLTLSDDGIIDSLPPAPEEDPATQHTGDQAGTTSDSRSVAGPDPVPGAGEPREAGDG